MTSAINPQNIDGAYPVAGQDNDSQGFRDNFTNTKTNFEYAAQEITDLQSKAVLKAALTGTSLDNDMGGSILSNVQLQNISQTAVSLGPIDQAPYTAQINFVQGSYYTFSTPAAGSGTIILSLNNPPPGGTLGSVRVQIFVQNVGWTLTLPASVTLGTTGIQGLSGSVITFGSTGYFEFEFETSNGGTSYTIFDLNRPLISGYTNQLNVASTLALSSSEDLANGAAANVNVTTSYFTTAAAETATLGTAPTGTIKIFYARDVSLGPMVITVTGVPVWGGAGTITFNTTGQGCMLWSTGGGWVCVGNNGASFA